MSTFRRIWLWSFLGVTTGGDTHPVGSLTFSMMSWAIRCFISSSIFWCTLNGCRRGGCATSLKSGSTFKSTWIPFSFPIPWNRSLYFSNTSFRLSVPSDWLLSVAIELVTRIFPGSHASLYPSNGSVRVSHCISYHVIIIFVLDSVSASKQPRTGRVFPFEAAPYGFIWHLDFLTFTLLSRPYFLNVASSIALTVAPLW